MLTEALYRLFVASDGVSTDTRTIERGKMFFALKGSNFNGNLYAAKALDAGAAYAIVDEPVLTPDERIILVPDVLSALQQLAQYHRRQLKTILIAVGGSNGKTTTKELIARVLGTSKKTFSTQGNLNNHIGVPLSLLAIDKDTDFAVIEIGANHLGETKFLCELAEPDFGLITNNGKDHLEGYGSIDGVRTGNGELYDYLLGQKKMAFVNAGESDLMQMSARLKRLTYGSSPDADIKGVITTQFPYLELSINGEENPIHTKLTGSYNFANLMAAVCIGYYFEIDHEKIIGAIESYVPSNNRSQTITVGTNTFLLDAYNANPSSMNAALDHFILHPSENKILILGDMAELGAASDEEHRAILEKIKSAVWKKVLLVGEAFRKADGNGQFMHFSNVNELKSWFVKQNFQHCHFLLKASRVIALEKLLE